ncbi:MAG: hypothetical protein JJV96_01765 [Alphaproteobacteria bacterium]|nr:hypothetical protein [Alphaproteobacteria bacterium]
MNLFVNFLGGGSNAGTSGDPAEITKLQEQVETIKKTVDERDSLVEKLVSPSLIPSQEKNYI